MTWTTQQRSNCKGLAAIDTGTGPQVLLLHGVGLRSEAWAKQIEALAKDFRVTAIDMPGHGESGLHGDFEMLSDYAQAALTFADDRFVVIGHSMGAMIALYLAAHYPDRVQAAVALNAIFERSDQATEAVRARAAELDGVTVADPSGTLVRWFGHAASAECDACRHWLSTVNPMGYKKAYSIFAQEDGPSRADLAKIQCPVLFMTGAEEPNSLPAMSTQMAALTPKGQAHIVDDAAHMLPMTHPTHVNDALLNFLGEVPL